MNLSHAITYAVFQMMVSLFMASPLSKQTQEHDFISIASKQMERLLEQPKAAGIRYYFILAPTGKMSAVILALDSNGQEIRSFFLNAKNPSEAERGIKMYAEKNMVAKTGTIFGTIGLASENGKLIVDDGKAELLQLARTSQEVRAYYAIKENSITKKQNVVLCFASVDKTGAVLRSAAVTETPKILDASFECPPFCKTP